MIISLTDSAAGQVKEMMQDEEAGARLRFGIQGGGCSGLSYSLGFDHDVNDELDMVEDVNGVPVVINKQDAAIIEGTTIDFKQNMMGGGFSIDNPNAIVSCGCGSSFRTDRSVGTPEKC
ncbi:iron-sulfur cluster assembly protein [Lentibacillus persicus]|uniref:Iron-sulfur cluster assembly protein n=1 Tax=Lentibacillus persicus TaxID=640948 RepID=A0A1I1WGN7_9BACI|nr:iron-sulfur cluster assembly accessory protein [Lentibacillus persicus]SFD94222.1 iron-sulfur cluster assembly protein [Lentibacillus persicus]